MTKKLQYEDFGCKCGCKKNKFNQDFFELIKLTFRTWYWGINITSAYRCEKHNKKVGGSPTSSHLKGLAVDIAYEGPVQLGHLIDQIIKNRIACLTPGRIGIYKKYIHWDLDLDKKDPCIWTG